MKELLVGTQWRKEEDSMSVGCICSGLNSWPQDHRLKDDSKFQAGLHWWQVQHPICRLLRPFSSVAACMWHPSSCSARCYPLASWQIHEEIISSVCGKLSMGFSPSTVLKRFRRLRHKKEMEGWLQVKHGEKQRALLNHTQLNTSSLLSRGLRLRHWSPFFSKIWK